MPKRKDDKPEDCCPNCGYCPHCGQSAKPPRVIPMPYPVPQPHRVYPWYRGEESAPYRIVCGASEGIAPEHMSISRSYNEGNAA